MIRGGRTGDSRRNEDWLFEAYRDFLAAKKLMEDERCYNAVAFHCQQCIEKALKSYLLIKKKRLYDGHNLTWLCKQAMGCDEHFSQWLSKSASLNRYYIETRYPADILLDIDTNTINNLMEMTNDMLCFISKLIKFDFNSYHKKK